MSAHRARTPDDVTRFGSAIAGLCALVLAACASDAPSEPDEIVSEPDRFAVVTLAYSEDDFSARVSDELVARAFFVETIAERTAVLRALGVGDLTELGVGTDTGLELDTCRVRRRLLPDLVPSSDVAVRLLDAGEVLVESASHALPLASNYFPDIAGTIVGVSYDAVSQNTALFAPGAPLTVRSDGSDEVGAFSTLIDPPTLVRLHSVAGLEPRGARVWLDEQPERDAAEPFHVSWSVDEGETDPDTVTEVRYVRRGFDRVASIDCRVVDDGEFTVPEAALAQLPSFGADQTDWVSVRRARASSFSATSISDGAIIAVSRDAVLLK